MDGCCWRRKRGGRWDEGRGVVVGRYVRWYRRWIGLMILVPKWVNGDVERMIGEF